MNLDKQKAFLISFTYFGLLAALTIIGIKYLLPLFLPFVIGIIIAAILRPVIDRISTGIRLKRSHICMLVLLVFYGFIFLLISMFGNKIFLSMQESFYQLPALYKDTIEPLFNQLIMDLIHRYPDFNGYLQDGIASINDSIFSYLTTISTKVVTIVTGFAGGLPTFIINFLFTIVSSCFFTIDYHQIVRFLMRQCSPKKRELILNIQRNGIQIFGKLIKAYAFLMSLTCIELSIGFWLLGLERPFALGILIAIVDILPVLGTGAVLLPWCVLSFAFGNTPFALGILALYIVVTIVRQSLEPKVIGKQVGLHPVVTLVCIFAGGKLFGVIGIFLLPIAVTIVKKMNDEGTIHCFR